MTLTAQELLEGAGITLSDYRPGQHHRTCPLCSAKRRKEHQPLQVLGVKIDADGATWHCNHCGWAGPEKGKHKSNGAGGEFAAIYDYPGFQKVRYPKGHVPRFAIRHRESNGWKWGAGDADTGVTFRTAPGVTGLKILLDRSEFQPPGTLQLRHAFGGWVVQPIVPVELKPAGEWNAARIELRGRDLRIEINGREAQARNLDNLMPGRLSLPVKVPPLRARIRPVSTFP